MCDVLPVVIDSFIIIAAGRGSQSVAVFMWQAVRNCRVYCVSSFIARVIRPYFPKTGVHKYWLAKFYNEGPDVCESSVWKLEYYWNVMAHDGVRDGKWRGNWRMEWVASTLHTTSEHGVSSITTADAHTWAASSRLNWRPPADLNGLVRFAERRNLVSARVSSHFNWPLRCVTLLRWFLELHVICAVLFDKII